MSEPRKPDLRKMLSEEDVIQLLMKRRGCDREEAEELFEQFKIDHPGVETGDC
jgi:hypothetical protein